MRVMVTGAAGFIGSHMAEDLLAEGHDVVGLDAFTDYYARRLKESNLRNLLSCDRFTFHELDLRTDDLAGAMRGVDAIVHEAAMPGLPRSWTDFDAYVGCNLTAARRLLDAAREADVKRFVHISTSSVYGAEALGDETSVTQPVSPYGITKLAAEQLVLAYHRAYGFPALVLRYFSIYGPRQRPDMAYNIFVRAMMAGTPITVFGDGSQSRTSTYISDCVEATRLALLGGRMGEVYNIGGGEPITVTQSLAIIARLLGTTPHVRHEGARAGDQSHTRAVIDKAREELGFQPRVSPIEGLALQVAWQSSHQGT